jgi:hypothetical protein
MQHLKKYINQLPKICILFYFISNKPIEVIAQSNAPKQLTNAAFTFKSDKYGIAELYKTNDVHATNYIKKGRLFGDITIRYVNGRKLDSVRASNSCTTNTLENGTIVNTWATEVNNNKALQLAQSFALEQDAIIWNIILNNTSNGTIRIEDLAIPLLYNNGGGENPIEIFEQRVVKHHFISGNNSFLATSYGIRALPGNGAAARYFLGIFLN